MPNTSGLRPFQKGQSGNPGGRPKGIAAMAREYADQAVGVLALILTSEDAKHSDRVAAAKELLDRGFGKAISMSADVSDKLEDVTIEQLRDTIDALTAARDADHGAETHSGSEATH